MYKIVYRNTVKVYRKQRGKLQKGFRLAKQLFFLQTHYIRKMTVIW